MPITTTLTWHEASDPPDAGIEVLITPAIGDPLLGEYDDEEECYASTSGRKIHDALYWAHVTTPEVEHA